MGNPKHKMTLSDLQKSACWHRNSHLLDLFTEKPKKENKFGAKKITIDGITFDSTLEGYRYGELKIMERAKLISDLKLQVKYKLSCCTYIADFVYVKNGEIIVEDVKSSVTRKLSSYRLKRKLMKLENNITIKEYGKK